MTSTWKEFWNTENSIYVSARHMRAHYAKIADDVVRLLSKKRPLTFLDWGCGEALGAPVLAESGISVYLYDPVSLPLKRLKERFTNSSGITVLDDVALGALPEKTMDVVMVNSVLQYLSREEFVVLLPVWRRLLTDNGQLFLGDVVRAGTPVVRDVLSLLTSGLLHGFFFDALFGLVRTFFSEYRTLRTQHGFTEYTEVDIITLLKGAGFVAERVRPNIGFSTHRMLIRAVKKTP